MKYTLIFAISPTAFAQNIRKLGKDCIESRSSSLLYVWFQDRFYNAKEYKGASESSLAKADKCKPENKIQHAFKGNFHLEPEMLFEDWNLPLTFDLLFYR